MKTKLILVGGFLGAGKQRYWGKPPANLVKRANKSA